MPYFLNVMGIGNLVFGDLLKASLDHESMLRNNSFFKTHLSRNTLKKC
jgi:hypothetical protein